MNMTELKECKSEFMYQETSSCVYPYILTDEYTIKLNFNIFKPVHGTMYNLLPDLIDGRHACLHIFKNYAWDGASGPTVRTKNTVRASCVHDVLYQMIKLKELPKTFRKLADKELKRIMLEDGYPSIWTKIRANYYYTAVRLFGWMHT